MCYNGFTIKINLSLRDSEMEGVPTKIRGRGTLSTNKNSYKMYKM